MEDDDRDRVRTLQKRLMFYEDCLEKGVSETLATVYLMQLAQVEAELRRIEGLPIRSVHW